MEGFCCDSFCVAIEEFKMKKLLAFPLVMTLTIVLCYSAAAQITPVSDGNQVGVPPFGTFSGSNFDVVSFQNGNLHISIPIQSVPQRNGKTFTWHYVYDIPSWLASTNTATNTSWISLQDKEEWRLVSNAQSWAISFAIEDIFCGTQQYAIWDNYVLTEPDGTKHPLFLRDGKTAPSNCAPSVKKGLTLDGSGILVDVSLWPTVKVTLKDGTQVSVPWEDNNGNLGSATNDMLGRNTLNVQDNRPTNATWSYTDSNGATQTYTLTYQTINISTHFCGTLPNCSEDVETWVVPSTLALPNNSGTYRFTYQNNDAGQLTRIDLPTGGYISYTYGRGPNSLYEQDNPTQCNQSGGESGCIRSNVFREQVATRTVFDGNSTNLWTYSAGASTVIDPLGNKEVHTYSTISYGLCPGSCSSQKYETQLQYYDPSGTLLRTIQKDYVGKAPGGGLYAPSGVINIRQIRETTTLANNLVKKTETDYETVSASYLNANTTYLVTWLNPTAFREYDWGSGASGSLLRQTTYSYLHTGNSNYLSRNITGKVLTKIIADGSGSQVAKTINEYDNYSHPNQSMLASGAMQHDSAYGTSFIYRGNLTAVQDWVNTTNTYLTSTHQFDDAGNVLSVIDPLGNKTSFDFTDSWSSTACNPTGAGKAYVTKVTNALSQATTGKYFACSGLVGSATDPNTQPTSFSYDFADRRTATNFPDGGQVSVSYNDAAPVSSTTTTKITSTLNHVSTVPKDVLGRVQQSKVTSDPQGTDYADTTYDALSRASTASNPYRTNTEPTYGLTTTQYDALGRVSKVIPPDGNSTSDNVSTTYDILLSTTPPRNCTLVTDQAGKARKSCLDGLGRMTQVFEDPSGINYETDYAYDTLDNLQSVTQKGGTTDTTKWRTRTFSFDSLSRLLSATNPESGQMQYTYNADSNVLTKTAPLPNQTGTATVVTTYTYDALNRLKQKSYNDSQTAKVLYGYDGVALSGCTTAPPALTDTYPKGRRTAMCDGSGATSWKHDQMGRVLTESRTIVGTSAWTKSAGYTYNLDGSIATISNPGVGRVMTYTTNGAGRQSSVINSGGNINFVTGASYAAFGGLTSAVNGSATGFAGITTTDTFNKRLQPVLCHQQVPRK